MLRCPACPPAWYGRVSHRQGWRRTNRRRGANEWIVFRVTDISVPPVDLASDDIKKLKETLRRGLTDEQIAQYVTKLETEIGTTINQTAFAQVTGANN